MASTQAAIPHRDSIGEAASAVDGGMHAERLARRTSRRKMRRPRSDAARYADHAGDHEIDVAIRAIAPNHNLVPLETRPFALVGDLAQAGWIEALEKADLLQAEQGRHANRGLLLRTAAALPVRCHGATLQLPFHSRQYRRPLLID
jgi:hypothetical protein